MCEFVKMQCVVGSPLQSSAEFCLTQEMTRLEKKSSWLLSLHFPPKTTGGVSKVENNIFPSALKSQISQKLSHMSGYQTVSTEWILLQDVSIQNAVNMTLLYDFRAPKNYSFNFPKIIFSIGNGAQWFRFPCLLKLNSNVDNFPNLKGLSLLQSLNEKRWSCGPTLRGLKHL